MPRPKKHYLGPIIKPLFHTPETGYFKLNRPKKLAPKYDIAVIDTSEMIIVSKKDYAEALRSKGWAFVTMANQLEANMDKPVAVSGNVIRKRKTAKRVKKLLAKKTK